MSRPDSPLRCDASLADRRLFLFVTERPEAELKEQFRRFLSFAPGSCMWVLSGSASVLWEDLASRNARSRAIAERRRQRRQERETRLGEVEATLRKGPPGMAAMGYSPRRSTQAWQEGVGWVRLFRGLPGSAQQAVLNGQSREFPFGALDASGQESVRGLVRNFSFGKGSASGAGSDQFVGQRDFRNTLIQAFGTAAPGRSGIAMRLRPAQTGGSLFLADLCTVPRPEREGAASTSPTSNTAAVRSLHPEGVERAPALQPRVSLKPGTVEEVLTDLVGQVPIPLLGEYDPCHHLFAQPGLSRAPAMQLRLDGQAVTNLPLWQALDRVCAKFGFTWDYQEKWLLLRSTRTLDAWAGERDLSPLPPRNRRQRKSSRRNGRSG